MFEFFAPMPPQVAWARYRPELAAYAQTPVNYDLAHVRIYAPPPPGWRHDEHATPLPPELPGPPAAAGSFAAGQQVLWHYTFPPPQLIRGYFDPGQPLAQRIMLLRARFLGFVFHFGVRIVDVVDETRLLPGGGTEQVWGYGYRTLAGHFEEGQINFSLHKNLTTGAVEFRIESVSRMAPIRNPFYWLGFTLFGRTLQRRFASQTLARMRQLVAQELTQPQTMPVPRG